MGNSRKQTAPIRGQVREMKPMTAEERQEQAMRMYMQKRESIATGVLFNMVRNESVLQSYGSEDIAVRAIEIADAMIEKLYFTPSAE